MTGPHYPNSSQPLGMISVGDICLSRDYALTRLDFVRESMLLKQTKMSSLSTGFSTAILKTDYTVVFQIQSKYAQQLRAMTL